MEEKAAAAPPWEPSVGTVFRRLAGAGDSGRSPEASLPSPSSSGNGVATRISNLHGVKRKPVRLILLLPCYGNDPFG
jgi:dual specificity protein kinase YAK1